MRNQSSRSYPALVLCLIPAIYFAASAVFALVHFGDYASGLPQFLRYAGVPAAIAVFFLIAALAMPARVASAIGLSAISILGGFFAFEAMMTAKVVGVLLGLFGAGETLANADGVASAGLPPGYTVKRLNRDMGSTDLSRAVLGGIPGSQVLMCWQGKDPVIYRADRLGFNNPDSVYDTTAQVVIVGDSFMEGMCLPPGKDVTSRLRDTFPGSVSLAMRGNGPLLELAVMGRFVPALRPRHVVMAFFAGNDWDNLQHELTLPWLSSALQEKTDFGPPTLAAATMTLARSTLDTVREERMPLMDVILKTRIVRNFLALNQTSMQLGLTYPKRVQEIEQFETILKQAKRIALSQGATFDVLYIPQSSRYVGVLPNDFVFDHLRNIVKKAAASAGVGVIDLVDVFAADPGSPPPYAADAHFSERGAEVVAAAIAAHLRQQPNATVLSGEGS